MNLRQGVVALALSVTAALGLAACTGGAPEAGSLSDSPTPTTSTEPSNSPDTSVSSDPSASAPVTDPANPLTPVQTIREFFKYEKIMEMTGDDSGFSSLHTGECKYCTQYAQKITSVYRAGGWVKGANATLQNLRAMPNIAQNDTQQIILGEITRSSGSFKETADSTVTTTPTRVDTYAFVLNGNRRHWLIRAVIKQ